MSKLRCISRHCRYWDPDEKRNCSHWDVYMKCDFRDVSEVRSDMKEIFRGIAERAMGTGYTTIDISEGSSMIDMVNKPPHYKFFADKEVKDVIVRAVQLNFSKDGVGAGWYWQVLKYLLRCGRKNALLEDLKKAKFYLDALIEEVDSDGSI